MGGGVHGMVDLVSEVLWALGGLEGSWVSDVPGVLCPPDGSLESLGSWWFLGSTCLWCFGGSEVLRDLGVSWGVFRGPLLVFMVTVLLGYVE